MDVVAPEHKKKAASELSMNKAKEQTSEIIFMCKDGSRHRAQMAGRPQMRAGRTVGMILIMECA